MDSCVMRVLGDNFNPDNLLVSSKLIPSAVFYKGKNRPGRKKASLTNGFTCDIGNGTFNEQISLSMQFISRNLRELKGISNNPEVESFFIDFSIHCRVDNEHTIVQRDMMPPDFIQIAAAAGLGICITITKSDANTQEVASMSSRK